MSTNSKETLCVKCTKAARVATCYGCQQAFCSRHFIKHRLNLAQQMDDLHKKYEIFQKDLDRDNFEQPLLSSIYSWERKAIRKIQEIAEKAREDLQQWMEKTKNEIRNSLEQMNLEFESNEKSDDYTETDLDRWVKQLEEFRNLLEKPTTVAIVQDKKSSSTIHAIKFVEQQGLPLVTTSPQTNECTAQKLIQSLDEHFISVYGPCKLSEDDHVVTHTNYRAGLSEITGHNYYSSGKHAIDFLIEKKGNKNIFIGIQSSSQQTSSSNPNCSVYGWWNFDYAMINGECEGNNNNEIIQTGDQITLVIDCDNQKLQLRHHRTRRVVQLPVKLEVCPFPWKLLVKLLSTGDCLRILESVPNK